jgi:hypothetical protein
MRIAPRLLTQAVAVIALTAAGAGLLSAQGVTSAAVQGRITREGGGDVEAAIVLLINTQSGTRQQTGTRSNGRYNFENVTPGGPYTIEVRAIGFERAMKSGIMLALGQRYIADLEVKAQPVTLEELTVVAATNVLINTGRTGAAQVISDSALQRLPLLNRNFTSLLNTNPQVTNLAGGAVSIAGQNNRFNVIQIDGGVNNDLFGLAASGTPGGQAGAKPISLEALKEFQILVAPFDVRQGSFSGGLVNAVTKSGTNRFSGSLFGYIQREDLVGKDTAGARIAEFDIKQYGFTFGGPIARDRVHFFLSGDLQDRAQPFFGFETSIPSTGITSATADRVAGILRERYDFDPGGPEGPVLERPDNNLFAKITAQISDRHSLEVSHNFVDAGDDNFNRGSRTRTDRDGWQLSNSGYRFNSKTNSTRLKLASLIGSASNELLISRQTVRDQRTLPNRVPLILVQGDVAGNYIAAGGEKFSHANSLDQDIYEITDNVTFGFGSHQFTLGTHNEFFSFRNVFFPGSLGVWTFASADALDAATPNRYERAIETRPGGSIADWGVKQLGLYVQDRWNPFDRLSLTFGLRLDVPYNDKPVGNDALRTGPLGINTAEFPNGNRLVSPRFGFNYDVWGTGQTVVRGGAGIFSGRPPYVWMSNAFTNTGLEQVTLICTGTSIPAFTVNPDAQPSQCAAGGPPSPPAANVNYFDPNFKFQQSLRLAFGLDHEFGSGVVGTIDLIHSRARNTMYLTDANLNERGLNGEGRMMYGALSSTGSATPSRITPTVRAVVKHENRSQDLSTLITAQLQKRFGDGVEFSVGYTWQRVKDLYSLTSSIATSNLNFTSLDGTLADRNLATSGFEVPHKISISGTVDIPFGVALSLIYTGRSGLPYAYTANGDANADGFSGNDLMYVPADAGDISLATAADYATLNEFIASEKCLREQRGRIMARNSCRNPWVGFLDMRLHKFITWAGQDLQLTADIFNLLNLLDADWGLQRETSGFEEFNFLRVVGIDDRGTPANTADDRPRYDIPKSGGVFVKPSLRRVQTFGSRWRIQVGAKYVF